MRRLHAVGQHEKFVASGVYEFEQAGVKIGLMEYWSIHEVGGAHFIRVDVDGRAYDGRSRLYEALLNPDGRFERVDVRAYGSAEDVVKEVRASYTFFDEQVDIIRVVNRNARFEESVRMPSGYVAHFGSKLLYGTMVPHTSVNQSQVRMFIADHNFTDLPRAFTGRELAPESYQFMGEEQIKVGHVAYSARLYRSSCANVWLDEHNILLCEQSASQTVALTQYARRPELKPYD
jgi:hypothetical protein